MIREISTLDEEGVKVYGSLTDHRLRQWEEGSGIFIAESPKVIKVALDEGYEPLSLLCERKHIEGDAASIITGHPEIPVYTGTRELLSSLTGYTLTRGVLCAMKRKRAEDSSEICRKSSRIAVIESVCDTTNIGSIFRSAAALGIGGVLLTPDSCDPLNRRSIRVSMGTVFKVKWAFCDNPIKVLHENDFATVALTLHSDSIPISDPVLKEYPKLALVLGTEGDGLSEKIISECDYKAIIPMHYNVDSLNVGAAAAIAFWELRDNASD